MLIYVVLNDDETQDKIGLALISTFKDQRNEALAEVERMKAEVKKLRAEKATA